jgi:hypothetical protein
MKNVAKKSLENVANAASILSPDEQVLLKGGRRRYFIGTDEVSEAVYKAYVECHTGSPSPN